MLSCGSTGEHFASDQHGRNIRRNPSNTMAPNPKTIVCHVLAAHQFPGLMAARLNPGVWRAFHVGQGKEQHL